jgi:hypothetical protein
MLALLKRIPPMARGPLALLALGGLFAVNGLTGYLAQPRPLLDSLVAPTAAVVGVVVVLAWLARRAEIASRTRRFNINPGGTAKYVIDHEVAHVDKGNQFGGHTARGRVFPNGSGYVEVVMPRSVRPEHDVAVDMAGSVGEGRSFWSNPHAWGDRANAAARVSHLPPDEQRRVYREAERLSYRRFWESGEAASVRRALARDGRYH